MSTTRLAYRSILASLLGPLTIQQRMHRIQRWLAMMQQVHNAVGDVYMRRSTIDAFASAHPDVYAHISGELKPYLRGAYLNEAGWVFFESQMFRPREQAVLDLLVEVRAQQRSTVASGEENPFTL